MNQLVFFTLLLTLTLSPLSPSVANASDNFLMKKVSDGIFVAQARHGKKAQSNVLIIIGRSRVMLAGAHFSSEVITDLTKDVSALTPFPIRSVILTHHHKGFPFFDFDFPRSFDIILTEQTRQNLSAERRSIANNLYAFNSNLTIDFDGMTIELSNVGSAHSNGDLLLYLPDTGILFTSDLVFNNVIGFMGDGSFRNWLELLDQIEELGATTIIPGLGEPATSSVISRFRTFFRDFITEVIRLKSLGKTFSQAVKEFSLPAMYRELPGYKTYISANIERAFADSDIR
ncbi:MAG: MBL fold metallo-hydrolase [Desulfuromonadia bacterium]